MHDKNGKPIKVGDKVSLEGIITSLSEIPTFCNVTVTVGGDKEHSEYNVHGMVTINAKQTEKIED